MFDIVIWKFKDEVTMKKRIKFLMAAVLAFGLQTGKVNAQTKSENSLKNQAVYCMDEMEEESVQVTALQGKTDLEISAKSAYLMDFTTQTVMYAQNEEKRLPIASMCKIMTLLLSFEAIEAGNLDINEELCISERAASMGGSQVFLEANAKYSVKELIKSIVVCSANDSCVAMAERIAGNEQLFVDAMNEKAKEIGANNTLFANCTGLPKEPQYSCAKDVAIMLKNLLKYDKYYEFGKVWMDKFQHPEGRYTEITNTNKLVRFYDGCDGGKTGFTNEAGFCLAATAKRDNLRVISVVIGEENSATRFADVRTMFDYAFATYKATPLVEANVELEDKLPIQCGKCKTVSIAPMYSAYTLTKRNEKSSVTTSISYEKLKAPIAKGAVVGELIVFTDGIESARVPLIAMEEVKKANFFDCLQEIARSWNG
jgi:D-alanyl-D-alanine carboxypeptidase (penicillin-binding protein 5/6)